MEKEFYSIQITGLDGELLFESLVENLENDNMRESAFRQALNFLEEKYLEILPTIQANFSKERQLKLDCFLGEGHIAGVFFNEEYLAKRRKDLWEVAFRRLKQEIQWELFPDSVDFMKKQ
jgi:hypothetical protein